MRDEDDDIEDGEDDAPAPAAKPTKPVLPRLVKPGDAAPSATSMSAACGRSFSDSMRLTHSMRKSIGSSSGIGTPS